MKYVTFCGHREIENTEPVRQWLYGVIERLLRQGASVFYLGGYGAFDKLAAVVLSELKSRYSGIKAVIVLPYLDKQYDAELYDGAVFPPIETVPKRYAIVHRNRWMIENTDVLVAYVLHDWGGAAKALEYAEHKGKQIIKYK